MEARRKAFRSGFGSRSFGGPTRCFRQLDNQSLESSHRTYGCIFGASIDSSCSHRLREVRTAAAVRNRRVTSDNERPWTPVTKLGRLVKDGKVTNIEDIYLRSLQIQEYQIVDSLLPKLREKVLKILPVQKHTRGTLRTRFKAFVVVGDGEGHVGLGVKCAKEVASAIRGAIYHAKTSVIPLRRGVWRGTPGVLHTVPCKICGLFDDVEVKLFPAPRYSGIFAPSLLTQLLVLGGIQDCFVSVMNYNKSGALVRATFNALQKTYYFISDKEFERQDELKFQMQAEFLARKLIKNHSA